MQNPAVIHHQQVTATQQLGQIREMPIDEACAVKFQQAAGGTLRQRSLGNQFWRQEIIEIRQCQRSSIQFAGSTSP